MYKFFILLIVSVLLSMSSVCSQDSILLIPYLKNGKYGFANESVKLQIKAKYSFAMPFGIGSGLAMVARRSKPNIINREGKIIFKNASTDFFRQTPKSMNVIPHQSVEAIAIDDFVNPKANDAFFLISATDKQDIFDKINNLYVVRSSGKVFLINALGDIKSKPYSRLQHIDNKLIEYCITRDFINNKCGLLNSEAQEVVRCIYDDIVYEGDGNFSLFLFGAQRNFQIPTKNFQATKKSKNTDSEHYKIKIKDKKIGIIDKLGKFVVAPKYDRLIALADHKFLFVKNDSIGIINANERFFYLQIEKNIDETEPAYVVVNKHLVFFEQNNKWQLINLAGQRVGDNYDGVFVDFQNVMTSGATGVSRNSKIGAINRSGKLIIKPECDTIYGLRENSSFVVKKGDKWHWLNSKGNYIYRNFDNFNYLIARYLLVCKHKRWFYVNEQGQEFMQ